MRSPLLASPGDSRLLIVDVQEKLMPHIEGGPAIVEACRKLLDAARLFEIPITATEQYPQGLGPTVVPLNAMIGTPIEKKRFSAAEAIPWGECSGEDARHRVVVAGVEAHVCVQQTVLDLLSRGYVCLIPVDAVGSRHTVDRTWALDRMAASGATLTTTEAILFEWCETAESPSFKALSRLVTGR